MKKTNLLVATAVLASMSSVAVAADVEIYGRAHLSLDFLDDGADTGTNISSNSSRLGFRASSELDNGLEAFMQLEQNIRYDQRGGEFASRDSFVGIRGNFGQVRLGYFDTPLKAVRSRTDMFGDRLGDARNMTSGGGMSFDNRYRNGIHYRSPSMNGLVFDFQYTPHNATGATTDNDQESYSTSLTYRTGDWFFVAAYETYEGDTLDPTAVRLGTYVDITPDFRVSGFYQNATDVPGGDRDTFGIGASYKLNGGYTLRSQYYQTSDNDTANTGADMFVLGIDKRLGASTTLYATYGITSNDEFANFSVSSGGRDTRVTPVVGEDATGFSLGVIYNF